MYSTVQYLCTVPMYVQYSTYSTHLKKYAPFFLVVSLIHTIIARTERAGKILFRTESSIRSRTHINSKREDGRGRCSPVFFFQHAAPPPMDESFSQMVLSFQPPRRPYSFPPGQFHRLPPPVAVSPLVRAFRKPPPAFNRVSYRPAAVFAFLQLLFSAFATAPAAEEKAIIYYERRLVLARMVRMGVAEHAGILRVRGGNTARAHVPRSSPHGTKIRRKRSFAQQENGQGASERRLDPNTPADSAPRY